MERTLDDRRGDDDDADRVRSDAEESDAEESDAEEGDAEEGALLEHEFVCPYCGEPITMLLDLSEADQEYVEDCEVCCNPIAVHVRARHGALADFDASEL